MSEEQQTFGRRVKVLRERVTTVQDKLRYAGVPLSEEDHLLMFEVARETLIMLDQLLRKNYMEDNKIEL